MYTNSVKVIKKILYFLTKNYYVLYNDNTEGKIKLIKGVLI